MNHNNIDEAIKLAVFSKQWSRIYQSESIRIQEKLGNKIIDMQHIGSTAIPNIYAKPIIDIMIGVEDLNRSEITIRELVELGYEYLGEANVLGRLYFRIRGVNNFNIALCQYGGEIWTANILFRDYLRKNPTVAKRYSLFKKKIFDSGVNTLLKYSSLKQSLVDEILKNAKKEQ